VVLVVSEQTLKSIVAMICVTVLQVVNMLTVRVDAGIMVLVITVISLYAGYQIGIRRCHYARLEEEVEEEKKSST
jgi:hypothetical protein